jgi:hypothetical protein
LTPDADPKAADGLAAVGGLSATPHEAPMTTFTMILGKCPSCGKEFDAASNAEGEGRPRPGDWTMCFGCGELLAFDETLTPRALTEAEQREADADPRVRNMQYVHRMMRENRGTGHDPTSRRSRLN